MWPSGALALGVALCVAASVRAAAPGNFQPRTRAREREEGKCWEGLREPRGAVYEAGWVVVVY